MVKLDGNIFVSTEEYEYKNINGRDFLEQYKKCFILTQRFSGGFSFVDIENIEQQSYDGTMIKCEFVNNQNIKYNLEVPIECSFITSRGSISVKKINDMDVFVDSRGITCKLISKTFENNCKCELINITPMYNRNLFYNDILIKSNK